MFNLVTSFAEYWLIQGAKYERSKQLAGQEWSTNIVDALKRYGKSLDHCKDVHDVVRVFLGWKFWTADGWYQLDDWVKPPAYLLKEGGDDCDGWAMTHAQAVNAALRKFGYHAWIVSYEAEPWWMSHHYCLVQYPNGEFWVMQPQPTQKDWQERPQQCQVVFGPYASPEASVHAVAAMYQATVRKWDLRDDLYRKVV